MKGIFNSSYCLKEYHISILVYVSNRNIGQIHDVGFIYCTNINHKGLQRTANEYAEERRIYKHLIFTQYDQHCSILLAEFNMFYLLFTALKDIISVCQCRLARLATGAKLREGYLKSQRQTVDVLLARLPHARIYPQHQAFVKTSCSFLLKYLAPSIFRGNTVWNYQQITQKPHLKLNLI